MAEQRKAHMCLNKKCKQNFKQKKEFLSKWTWIYTGKIYS